MQSLSEPPSSVKSAHDCASARPRSLLQTIRLYPRERLLVPPFQWTSRHVELLRCYFEQPSHVTDQAPSLTTPEGERRAAVLAYKVATSTGRLSRTRSMEKFLEHGGSPLVRARGNGIKFYFRQRSAGFLPCDSFCLPISSAAEPLPVAAYTDCELIESHRFRAVVPAITRSNPPVVASYRLQFKALTPAEPLHDPFILAILIALARWQRDVLWTDVRNSDRHSFKVYVVLTKPGDREQLHVFTADISAVFLDTLDFPELVPPATDPVSIRHTMVPFKPYKLVAPRLFSLIVPPDLHREVKGQEGNDPGLGDAGSNPALEQPQADPSLPHDGGCQVMVDSS